MSDLRDNRAKVVEVDKADMTFARCDHDDKKIDRGSVYGWICDECFKKVRDYSSKVYPDRKL